MGHPNELLPGPLNLEPAAKARSSPKEYYEFYEL